MERGTINELQWPLLVAVRLTVTVPHSVCTAWLNCTILSQFLVSLKRTISF